MSELLPATDVMKTSMHLKSLRREEKFIGNYP